MGSRFRANLCAGQDALKHQLRMDAESAFREGKKHFQDTPHIKASELYEWVVPYGEERHWEFGGAMAGHLIGQFPHERIPNDKVSLYIHPENHAELRQPEAMGCRGTGSGRFILWSGPGRSAHFLKSC